MKTLIKPMLNLTGAVFLLFNILTTTTAAAEKINYKVVTENTEISTSTTSRGVQYLIEDGSITENNGEPAIPYKIIRLALPQNTRFGSINATGEQINCLDRGVNVPWYEGDIKTSTMEQYIPATKNEGIYLSDDLYPGKYVEIINKGMMGSQSLVMIAVYPLQYRPSTGEILLVNEINIQIQTEDSFNSSNNPPPGLILLKDIVDNSNELSIPNSYSNPNGGIIPGTTSMGIGAEYLIITSGELAPSFYPYAVWKNQKGLLTELVMIADILQQYNGEDDAAKLRGYLQDAYIQGAKWVLLGGDEDIIPIRYAYPGNVSSAPALRSQQITDVYYADLTGDWDVDGDGIYGEYNHDNPDIYPEVYVGRVPASNSQEADVWVEKALLYEQNPGNGDPSYLTKGLFICADQMRDLNEHVELASLMPSNFIVDYSRLAEEPSGGAQNPTQPTGEQVIDVMDEGWGFISNLNHGDFQYYAAKGIGYNHWPRSNVWGDTIYRVEGASSFSRLQETTNYGIHYSISCYTAAYDYDKAVFYTGSYFGGNTMMEAYLFLPDQGGVAYLGNTRWGWVTSSYLLQRKFIEYAFSDTARHLAVAETLSKLYYPTKRDIGYGHSVFGDPEMQIRANQPVPLTVTVPENLSIDVSNIIVSVSTPSGPVAGIKVCLWKPGELYTRGITNDNGEFETPLYLSEIGEMYITASGMDMIPDIDTVDVYIQSELPDDDIELPRQTALYANYPNPFNASTGIQFTLADEGHVLLEVFDIKGSLVKTLIDKNQQPGAHSIVWNCRNDNGHRVASGTYLYRLKTGNKNIVKKMALLK